MILALCPLLASFAPLSAPAQDEVPKQRPAFELRLLDAGDAPQTVRRLTPPSAPITLELNHEVDAKTEQLLGGRRPLAGTNRPERTAPTERVHVRLTVSDQEGFLRHDLAVVSTEMLASEEASMLERADSQERLTLYSGFTSFRTYTENGREVLTDLGLPKTPTQREYETYLIFGSLHRLLVVPFPTEPIGEGARWEISRKIRWATLSVQLQAYATRSFEIVSIEGSRVRIRTRGSVSAEDFVPIFPPRGRGLPPMLCESQSAELDGELVWDEDKRCVVEATLTINDESQLLMNTTGRRVTAEVVWEIQRRIGPLPQPEPVTADE